MKSQRHIYNEIRGKKVEERTCLKVKFPKWVEGLNTFFKGIKFPFDGEEDFFYGG